jgi:hypothetical protein
MQLLRTVLFNFGSFYSEWLVGEADDPVGDHNCSMGKYMSCFSAMKEPAALWISQ